MCNRYAIQHDPEAVQAAFGLAKPPALPTLRGEYFPGSAVPVVKPEDAGRAAAMATWGIELGRHRVTNSRSEKRGTWTRFMGRRVVFPMTWAVEWKYPLDLLGQPHGKPAPWKLFPADGSVAAVAGIADAGGAVSMMTCRAEGIAAEVHNKKPDDPRTVVFLTERADLDRWLDDGMGPEDVRDLLKPPPAGWLDASPLARPN